MVHRIGSQPGSHKHRPKPKPRANLDPKAKFRFCCQVAASRKCSWQKSAVLRDLWHADTCMLTRCLLCPHCNFGLCADPPMYPCLHLSVRSSRAAPPLPLQPVRRQPLCLPHNLFSIVRMVGSQYVHSLSSSTAGHRIAQHGTA